MKLVMIIGSNAVGKMTVGQELTKITDLRLFHNHMTIEPVLEIFGGFNAPVITKMRDMIFEEFVKTDNYGLIFTYIWAFDMQEDWDYIEHVRQIFLQNAPDTEFYFAELIAPPEVRLLRNETENRLLHKPTKRNTERSRMYLMQENTMRVVSKPGELPYNNYLRLENKELPAAEAAKIIKERFAL